MSDHFAALQQPRRPWLDAAVLKEAFHRASALQHPDITGGQDDGQFAALNAAYNVLQEPASRLRHLLELEAPEALARPQQIPPALADLFMRIAAARRTCAAFLQKDQAASSPLARALLTPEKLALHRELESAQAQLEAAQTSALAELQSLDSAWEARSAETVQRLATFQQKFAFLGKWSVQLREDLFKLSV